MYRAFKIGCKMGKLYNFFAIDRNGRLLQLDDLLYPQPSPTPVPPEYYKYGNLKLADNGKTVLMKGDDSGSFIIKYEEYTGPNR